MKQTWIALLGRCDKPTDAVEDYCRFLSDALRQVQIELHIERFARDHRFRAGISDLRNRADAWRGNWVLVQYTALAWSARGFPSRFTSVLKCLRDSGARVAVVYHDVEPYGGGRLIDRVRRAVQVRTMRQASGIADLAIVTVPTSQISWMKAQALARTAFIPVGANLPVPFTMSERTSADMDRAANRKTVAVFGVTGAETGRKEAAEIAATLRIAAKRVGPLRLVVLGRHSEDVEPQIRDELRDTEVDVTVLGLLNGEQVVHELSAADVLLFLRGAISSRRSSAIAGIACGLPVVATSGSETAPPITSAGIALFSKEEKDEPGATLARVLGDDGYRAELAAKSRRAYNEYFSWSAIAKQYVDALFENDVPERKF